MDEVVTRFGTGSSQRGAVTARLRRIYNLARATGGLERIRPSMLIAETLDHFIEHWQIKRDGTRRGIVEVRT